MGSLQPPELVLLFRFSMLRSADSLAQEDETGWLYYDDWLSHKLISEQNVDLSSNGG